MIEKRVMNWQPIETAPKDGTWVLLSGGHPDFDDCKKEIKSFSMEMRVFWLDDAPYQWSEYNEPTHWMPLPNPPEEE